MHLCKWIYNIIEIYHVIEKKKEEKDHQVTHLKKLILTNWIEQYENKTISQMKWIDVWLMITV